jgi:hydroxyacylglutathione hydrolase
MYTPGHSTGDLTLLLDDGSAFVGDLVQGRRVRGVTPPEFSIMAVDEEAMVESWHSLVGSDATTVFPGHGHVVKLHEILPVLLRNLERKLALRPAVQA